MLNFFKGEKMNNVQKTSVSVDDKTLEFETGRLALQADGAAVASYGETIILAAGQMGDPREGMDFFPLLVDFEPKFYATGKIKGSRFIKRETRPPDSAILVSRLVDRTMRPLFPKGTKNNVQLTLTLIQADGEHSAAATAINAASMAALLAGMPIEAPVGAVRVGMRENGEYFLDPTYEEIETEKLDLVVSGTEDAILMMEAGASLVSDEQIIGALEFAHERIKKICVAQKEFIAKMKIEKREPALSILPEEAIEAVGKVFSDADFDSISGKRKREVKEQLHEKEEQLLEKYESEIEEGTLLKGDLLKAFGKKFALSLRRRAFEKGIRLDERKFDEVRPIHVEVGLFPRLHGSALFQRGETQSLSILTVGGPSDGEIVDDPDRPEFTKQYLHHYNFPGYSVGEVKPNRGASRRDIGHGALGARAIMSVLPTAEKDNFPYFLRVVSEITSCNGSSSMAATCGSTLALMDAGIPIKAVIAGVAMGLFMDQDSGKYEILTDIQSFEDFDGDMDLKITGDENGITAVQMDIKVKGLDLSLLKEAFTKAKVARTSILKDMKKVIPEARKEMSDFAPRVYSMKINPDFIRDVIGKGGETIQKMCADFNVDINIEDDGRIAITAKNGKDADDAQKRIESITYEPKSGDIFENAIVKNIMEFGAFVEFLPGKEALVHISEIAEKRVEKVTDYLKEGQKVKVKIIGKDKMGRTKLTMKL